MKTLARMELGPPTSRSGQVPYDNLISTRTSYLRYSTIIGEVAKLISEVYEIRYGLFERRVVVLDLSG